MVENVCVNYYESFSHFFTKYILCTYVELMLSLHSNILCSREEGRF